MNFREATVRRQRVVYMASDFVMTFIAFFIFDICRYHLIVEPRFHDAWSMRGFLTSPIVVTEQILIPVALMFIYWLSGYYNRPLNRSRLQEFLVTICTAGVNSLLIFMALLINDRSGFKSTDYKVIVVLFSILFLFTYAGRVCITTFSLVRNRRKGVKYTTLIIGNSSASRVTYRKLMKSRSNIGYNVVGFIRIPGEANISDEHTVWPYDRIDEVIVDKGVEQVIISPEHRDSKIVLQLLDRLFHYRIPIKINPDTMSYVTSQIRLTDILGEPFTDLTSPSLSECSKNVKLTFDKLVSLTALTLLSPILAILAIAVKLSSPGPAIYSQQRLGRNRRPFNIYKFRSMIADSEPDGPALSSDNDPRITSLGAVMRKYRLDELPQFWNVLKGDMSLVGPRPEREYFINRIVRKAPYYSLVFQVRPGITSWGMVKFGYASTLRQMVERTRYDLIYITNMSLALDLKILIYTVLTIVRGKGV